MPVLTTFSVIRVAHPQHASEVGLSLKNSLLSCSFMNFLPAHDRVTPCKSLLQHLPQGFSGDGSLSGFSEHLENQNLESTCFCLFESFKGLRSLRSALPILFQHSPTTDFGFHVALQWTVVASKHNSGEMMAASVLALGTSRPPSSCV